MFCQSKHICILNQNTFVFCHTPDSCYHKCMYCHAKLQIIVSTTKDDLRPHWPPPLPLSVPCWHHCNRCHGCHIVAAIAAVAIATVAIALLLSLPRLPLSPPPPAPFQLLCYRFLVDCCLPLRCLCVGHRCLPSRLPVLAADAIVTVVAAANRCPLLLLSQPGDVQNITFKVIF